MATTQDKSLGQTLVRVSTVTFSSVKSALNGRNAQDASSRLLLITAVVAVLYASLGRNTTQRPFRASQSQRVVSQYSPFENGKRLEGNGLFRLRKSFPVILIDLGSSRSQDSSVVRFLRIDPMVNGSNPPSAKLSLRVILSVIPGVGIMRCGHVKRKDLDIAP